MGKTNYTLHKHLHIQLHMHHRHLCIQSIMVKSPSVCAHKVFSPSLVHHSEHLCFCVVGAATITVDPRAISSTLREGLHLQLLVNESPSVGARACVLHVAENAHGLGVHTCAFVNVYRVAGCRVGRVLTCSKACVHECMCGCSGTCLDGV